MNPARRAFLTQLKKLREQSGSPSCRRLAEASEELATLYPERGLPTLSVTAISEILAGRRANLPGSAWVTSYVLCCQRHAWQVGMLERDPGFESVPDWQEKLRAARAAEESAAPGPGEPPSSAAASPARPSRGYTSGSPLARPQYDYVAGQGAYARELLAELETGDPEAAYRVAVILAADPAHRDAAIALLLRPGTDRHLLALELLEADTGRFEVAVADHACDLAKAAADEGHLAAAAVFNVAAALCRSFTGVVELAATLLAERGEVRTAEAIRAANTVGLYRTPTPYRPKGFPASN